MRLHGAVRGFALVAVLWLVAALFVSVSGVLYATKGQLRTASWDKEQLSSSALADAAAMIVLRSLAGAGERSTLMRAVELSFEGRVLQVQVIPLAGLIDLNAAPESLLADLLVVAGGIDRDRATTLAQRIIDWRDPDSNPLPSGAEDPAYEQAQSAFRTRGQDFEAPEDLMQVLGFDFDLYTRVSKLVTVENRSSGRVNPASAPAEVLRVLAAGNAQVAAEYERARSADGLLADTTRFKAESVSTEAGTRYVLEVRCELSNGAHLVTRRFVDVGAVVNGIPWVTLRMERSVEAG